MCGETFFRRPKDYNWPRITYCSKSCGLRTRRLQFSWDMVDRGAPDECWEWKRARRRNGYGSIGSSWAHVADQLANRPDVWNAIAEISR
jgi:hypothetical protein